MSATSERNSIYKIIGTAIFIINTIGGVINFLIVWRNANFIWALVFLLIFAVSTIISIVPFFALHEFLDRIERLEKATIKSNNEFYECSPEGQSSTWWADKKRVKEPKEDYMGFSIDKNINVSAIERYKKTESDRERIVIGRDKWKCSCGKLNQNYVGTCSCGERRPS